MKHEPISLPELHQFTNTKQYRSPGVQEEISRTAQELKQLQITRPVQSLYNSPIWPVQKSDGTWRMTVGNRELKKVTLPVHAAVPNTASLIHKLSREIETYLCVLDLTYAFFSIPIQEES